MNAISHDASRHVPVERGSQPQATSVIRGRLGAVSLALAGILFVLYPAIRPFSDQALSQSASSEALLQAARAFAAPEWVLAHMLGMFGFTLVGLGLLGLHNTLRETSVERLTFVALVIGWLGICLTLPYYGGEAFGLHAIGQEALQSHNAALIKLADVVRGGPQVVMFVVGLLLVAVGAIMAAVAIWKSGKLARWSGVPFALAFAIYIPQFWGNQPLRVAHGVLVAIGCLWIAASMWRQSGTRAAHV